MALTEVSANVRRNGSRAQRPAHESNQGKIPKMVKPDAVSSMLKTSTETGDIGQFSVCPWPLPRSASRLPVQSRNGSVSVTKASFGTYAQRQTRRGARLSPRPMPSLPALSRHESGRSILASYNSNSRARCHAAPHIQSSISRKASPATVSSLYRQPSFLSVRGRPGFRQASPAFSEAQSVPMYRSRPGFHRTASVATATSSSASMFHDELPYSYRELNNSTSSFSSRLPSPAMLGACPGIKRSPLASRAATSISAPLPHTSTRYTKSSMGSFHRVQRSTAGSAVPLYYDYTEAFANEDCRRPAQEISISLPFSADHATPDLKAAQPSGEAHSPSDIAKRPVPGQSETLIQYNAGHNEQLKGGACEKNIIQSSEQSDSNDIEEDSSGKPRIPNAHSWRISEELPQDNNPHQINGLSRRQCSASLSAYPHYRIRKSTSTTDVDSAGEGEQIEEGPKPPLTVDENVVTGWYSSPLDSGSSSFLPCSRRPTERPKSSGPSMWPDPPAIVSPTPERPLSSHSRRRFSKILGMEDGGCSPSYSPATLSQPDKNLNVGRLRPALGNLEASYPARYSIPPFSPRNSVIAESAGDSESNGKTLDQGQGSGHAKSTTESLLDKHIQCLGLQTETNSETLCVQNNSDNDDTSASTVRTSRDSSTIKLTVEPAPKCRPLSLTTGSTSVPAAAGPRGQNLVSRSFSPGVDGRRRPLIAHPGLCGSGASSHSTSKKPPLDSNTTASTLKLSTTVPALNHNPVEGESASEDAPSDVQAREPSTNTVSSSLSNFKSIDSEGLYSWNDKGSSRGRSVQCALKWQVSDRRSMRMRLKFKRNSRRQDRFYGSEHSVDHDSLHTTRASPRDWASVVEPSFKLHSTALGSHSAENAMSNPVHAWQNSFREHKSTCDRPSTPLDIPNRRSSVVAIGSRQVKHSIDMNREMSRKTARTQYDKASVGEPASAPRSGALAPHLTAPYQDRPLKPMCLNMDFVFSPTPTKARQDLGATQSLFPDDSSAVQNSRRSLRKRFNLTKLRGALPSTAGAHPAASALTEKPEAGHSRSHPSDQMRGPRCKVEEGHPNSTIGMSEFTYCKRKTLERVKGWWRRRTKQRLGLKCEKDERKPR